MKEGATPGFNLFDLADRLRTRGWQVPAYTLPSDCQDQVIQRILVCHGVSVDLGMLLIDHIKDALEYFKKHPQASPLTHTEASGFSH